jgi:hypothetical protein
MKALRSYLWSTIALAAVGAFLIGLLVLNGTAQAVVAVAAIFVFLLAVARALDSEEYRKHDADFPSPPWGPGV